MPRPGDVGRYLRGSHYEQPSPEHIDCALISVLLTRGTSYIVEVEQKPNLGLLALHRSSSLSFKTIVRSDHLYTLLLHQLDLAMTLSSFVSIIKCSVLIPDQDIETVTGGCLGSQYR
jgi:hypothetical protein